MRSKFVSSDEAGEEPRPVEATGFEREPGGRFGRKHKRGKKRGGKRRGKRGHRRGE